jgi:cell division protein FtsB
MAGVKVLCISLIDGVYHYLEVEKRATGYFPQHPQSTTSLDALTALCRKAGEIHLSSIYPSAIYQRTQFPKVAKKFLPNLVLQDAREKMGVQEPIEARYSVLKEVTVAGTAKWQTAYCAVVEQEILSLWNDFKEFRKKIKIISPLSLATAAMVAQMEKPAQTFAVIWVGENSSLMLIASSEGVVHVARGVPLRLSSKPLQLDPPRPKPRQSAKGQTGQGQAESEQPDSGKGEAQASYYPAGHAPSVAMDKAADDDLDVDLESMFAQASGTPAQGSPDSASGVASGGATEEASEAALAVESDAQVDGDEDEVTELFPEDDSRQGGTDDASAPARDAGEISSAALEMEQEPDEPVETPDRIQAMAFARDLEKELDMTVNFFKQEFREPAPGLIYLLGNPNLRRIQEISPLSAAYRDVRFSVSMDKYRGVSDVFASENIHVLSNLFVSEAINFIPRQEQVKRKSNFMLNLGLVLLLGGIGLSVAWVDGLHADRAQALEQRQVQTARLAQAQREVAGLQAEVARLRPIEGWKQFFNATMAERPPWDMFISELAMLMDDYVVISNLQVLSGDGKTRNCRIQGQIKAENWEQGLELFREFGRQLQSSAMFDVSGIQYTPEGVSSDPSMFDFEMDLKLKTTGGA